MSNWKRLIKEPNTVSVLAIMCHDYAVFDEEFSKNPNVKTNVDNADIWINLAHSLRGVISAHLEKKLKNEGYDEYEECNVTDAMIIHFAMMSKNRLTLNDMICDTVETWLRHMGPIN